MACAAHAIILGKSGRISEFTGPDTWRFNGVSAGRIFLATEKVRIGKNTVSDTGWTRGVSRSTTPPDLSVFLKNSGPNRVISGPRQALFQAVDQTIRICEFLYFLEVLLINHDH